jgi:hypothetical protein
MTYQFPQNWPDSDPAPKVPTLQEIQFAEESGVVGIEALPETNVRTRRFGAVSTIKSVHLSSAGPSTTASAELSTSGVAVDIQYRTDRQCKIPHRQSSLIE